ncbi:MAG: transcription termination factor NusA [Planctomycetota bacterium]
MNAELVRIVDGIARERGIEKEAVFVDIEQAIASGLRRQYQVEDVTEFQVAVDRESGTINMWRNGEHLTQEKMGRIGAQTVKQVMIQLLRQDERGSIYEEYKDKVGTIVNGSVVRFEGPTMIVNLGRVEGIMPRSEQIPGEFHNENDAVQALIVEVRDTPSSVKIILSRSHPELIRRLFEREVPEVGERTIEIRALAREAGARTKLAVASVDAKVDAVGACVGVRGSRIRNIVDELGGEKIDIVRWNESSQILIANALKPAEVAEVSLCFELGRATVVVNEDQLSLAIGKRGQNVRLAARLTGWDVDILTPQEFQGNIDRLESILRQVPEVAENQDLMDRIIALGLIDVRDIEEVGEQPLMDELEIEFELAERMVDVCTEEAKIVVKEQEAKKKAEAEAKAAGLQGASLARNALLGNLPPAPVAEDRPSGQGAPALGEVGATTARLDATPAPSADEAQDALLSGPVDDTDTTAADEADEPSHQAGPAEHVEGMSPEIVTHDESVGDVASEDDVPPELEAMHKDDDSPLVNPPVPAGEGREFADEQDEEAALAEGRVPPPPA